MRTQTITSQQNMFKAVVTASIVMVFWLFANPMNAQTNTARTVTGVVSSVDGPLHGAVIVLKGTTVGVNTNETGAFQFPKQLRENDVLVVSFLGLKSKEITIDRVTAFIEPFLDEDPIIIHGALRTGDSTPGANQD